MRAPSRGVVLAWAIVLCLGCQKQTRTAAPGSASQTRQTSKTATPGESATRSPEIFIEVFSPAPETPESPQHDKLVTEFPIRALACLDEVNALIRTWASSHEMRVDTLPGQLPGQLSLKIMPDDGIGLFLLTSYPDHLNGQLRVVVRYRANTGFELTSAQHNRLEETYGIRKLELELVRALSCTDTSRGE